MLQREKLAHEGGKASADSSPPPHQQPSQQRMTIRWCRLFCNPNVRWFFAVDCSVLQQHLPTPRHTGHIGRSIRRCTSALRPKIDIMIWRAMHEYVNFVHGPQKPYRSLLPRTGLIYVRCAAQCDYARPQVRICTARGRFTDGTRQGNH